MAFILACCHFMCFTNIFLLWVLWNRYFYNFPFEVRGWRHRWLNKMASDRILIDCTTPSVEMGFDPISFPGTQLLLMSIHLHKLSHRSPEKSMLQTWHAFYTYTLCLENPPYCFLWKKWHLYILGIHILVQIHSPRIKLTYQNGDS